MAEVAQIDVVAALIASADDPQAYVVQLRGPLGPRALLWEFPGGKVEPGESDEAALVRECREELSVEIQVGPQVHACVHRYPDVEVSLRILRARIVAGEVQLSAERGYYTPQQMFGMPFCEADEAFIRGLAAGKYGQERTN